MLADLINQIKSTIDLTDNRIQNFVKYIVDTEEGLKKNENFYYYTRPAFNTKANSRPASSAQKAGHSK